MFVGCFVLAACAASAVETSTTPTLTISPGHRTDFTRFDASEAARKHRATDRTLRDILRRVQTIHEQVHELEKRENPPSERSPIEPW